MKLTTIFFSSFLIALLLTSSARDFDADHRKPSKNHDNKGGGSGDGDAATGFWTNPGGDFGQGDGFGIPGFNGKGWGNLGGGYGGGYGGPGGGYAHGGVIRPSVVCTERGPCYKKRVTCPAKCFSSYSRSGKNYGGGGGGGGCTIDCKKHCVGYC